MRRRGAVSAPRLVRPMRYDPGQHHRRSIRLRDYDYGRTGSYFVTIVSAGREPLFGQIRGGDLVPSGAGLEVIVTWQALCERFPTVALDSFVLMPNHVHYVVAIAAGAETAPLRDRAVDRPTLGQIVAFLKYESTKRINARAGTVGARVWQRNYYEDVVRDEAELALARQYVATNPLRWEQDRENPANVRP